MAVLLDLSTKLLIQGITGHQGRFHSAGCREFGTYVCAGVTPGKGGDTVDGVPVYDTVAQAVRAHQPNATLIFVPAKVAKDAVLEAIDAGLGLIIVITEHIPFHDALQMVTYARLRGARIVGPNCPGVISPCQAVKAGIMPSTIFTAGDHAVVSRSGTLTYEIVHHMSVNGQGQSTVLGLGGDPVVGTTFIDALALLQHDKETDKIVLVGEIGGTAEEEAAAYIKARVTKPVVAYIAGHSAPEGKRMGHAGAIVTRGRGTARSKVEALNAAGVPVATRPSDVPKLLKAA